MCIKSEKRFDFLKELVSTVPDLQGDHDEPLALYQNMTGETQEGKKDTSNASQRPKLPRQLSTPRPRYFLTLICTIRLHCIFRPLVHTTQYCKAVFLAMGCLRQCAPICCGGLSVPFFRKLIVLNSLF